MIVLNLCCENEHLFEGWFASATAFASQLAQGMVSCPVCASTQVSRRPAAPYLVSGASDPRRVPTRPAAREPGRGVRLDPDAVATVIAVLRRAGRESEDVGEQFADEARRIHYGDSEARSIKGQASRDDVSELLEEGITVLPLPSDEGDLH